MKAWVEYIRGEEERSGGGRLWRTGRHFGDWLALDGKVDGGVYGSTDLLPGDGLLLLFRAAHRKGGRSPCKEGGAGALRYSGG